MALECHSLPHSPPVEILIYRNCFPLTSRTNSSVSQFHQFNIMRYILLTGMQSKRCAAASAMPFFLPFKPVIHPAPAGPVDPVPASAVAVAEHFRDSVRTLPQIFQTVLRIPDSQFQTQIPSVRIQSIRIYF